MTLSMVPPTEADQVRETNRKAMADLISVREAAEIVKLHPDTLYLLCRTGQFPPAIKIGSRWRVSVPRLERFLHGEAS